MNCTQSRAMGADNIVSVMANESQIANAWVPNSAHNCLFNALIFSPDSLGNVLEMINHGKFLSITVVQYKVNTFSKSGFNSLSHSFKTWPNLKWERKNLNLCAFFEPNYPNVLWSINIIQFLSFIMMMTNDDDSTTKSLNL